MALRINVSILRVSLLVVGLTITNTATFPGLDVPDEFIARLFTNYTKNRRPVTATRGEYDVSEKKVPILVYLQALVRDIDFVDDTNQELSLHLSLRQEWTDPRLNYEHMLTSELLGETYYNAFMKDPDEVYIALPDAALIWTPDVFVSNEKRGKMHNLLQPNILVRLYANGTVVFGHRTTLVLSCPMKLQWYPFDRHICPVRFGSYSLAATELVLAWNRENPFELVEDSSAAVDHGRIQLANFKLINYTLQNSCEALTTMGSFRCAVAYLEFDRQILFYLVTIYIPTCLIVLISWLSFWFDVTATDARMALGVTTVLTMATHLQGVIKSTPSVSYTRAVDVFNGFGMLMVALALLEFAIVDFTLRSEKKISDVHRSFGKSGLFNFVAEKRARRIDYISRFVFPAIYFGFTVVYFCICVPGESRSM